MENTLNTLNIPTTHQTDIASVLNQLAAQGIPAVVILSPNMTTAEVARIGNLRRGPRVRTVNAETPTVTATSPQNETPENVPTGNIQRARRGRKMGSGGRYELTGKVPKEMSRGSMTDVYNSLKKSQRGFTARGMSSSLGMPIGTIGWALNQLMKKGAVRHRERGRRSVAA